MARPASEARADSRAKTEARRRPSGSGHPAPRPLLVAVLDVAALGDDPARRAEALFRAGVDWIQLRDRRHDAGPLLRVTRALVLARDGLAMADAWTRCVLVNKWVDVAIAGGADGVHRGFDALPAAEIRALPRAPARIGASLHAPGEVEGAAAEGHDYVHLAPIWDPRSKPAERPALGPEQLAAACRAGLPVIAQGGLDPRRAEQAITAGAAGIAVTGAIALAADPTREIDALRMALDAAAVRAPAPAPQAGR